MRAKQQVTLRGIRSLLSRILDPCHYPRIDCLQQPFRAAYRTNNYMLQRPVLFFFPRRRTMGMKLGIAHPPATTTPLLPQALQLVSIPAWETELLP
jgi:hypothetical protein